MLHRHLTHQRFTLAAIDDIIAHGRWNDWAQLRQAILEDDSLLDKVEKVCHAAQASNPGAQRHHFWIHYAQKRRAAT